MPKTRVEFWEAKFESNMKRDAGARMQLKHLGWKVLVAWECEIYEDPIGVAIRLAKQMGRIVQACELPERNEILELAEQKMRRYCKR